MHVEKLTFSISRTIPMFPISGDPADEYANVKPFASITFAFDPEDAPISIELSDAVETVLSDAFEKASGMVFEQMTIFGKDLRALYKKNKG